MARSKFRHILPATPPNVKWHMPNDPSTGVWIPRELAIEAIKTGLIRREDVQFL